MTYFQNPSIYQKVSDNADWVDKIYNTMKGGEGDLADLLLVALDVLKKADLLPKFEQPLKSDKTSNEFREEGNKAYVAGRYQTALKYYNQALLHAPRHAKPMLLAYSNRSALLHKTKNFSASLHDIEACLKLGSCSSDILEKLTKRKTDCLQNLWREHNRYGLFTKSFFSLEGKRHPQVPCITNDVEITFDPDTQLPKVVAAKDIKIGTVVGVENAFTTLLNPMNYYLSCYYCHKMSLNLIPCPNCTYVLFCDSECKKLCMQESHNLECYMMELLNGGFCGPYSRITFRTVIKTRLMSSTWKEFIEASYRIGTERMNSSTIEQIFDGSHKFSMLNFVDLRDIRIGAMYNFAFMCATFVNQLTKQAFFLPHKADEKEEATKALARMTMGLLLKFYNKIEINNVADDLMIRQVKAVVPNYGYFAFASKLRHDCEANLIALGLNNKIGLVAVQPIKKGTELTFSYVNHSYDTTYSPVPTSLKERVLEMYLFAKVCRCPICTKTFKPTKSVDDTQRKQYRKWLTQTSDVLTQGDPAFKYTCDLLTCLQGLLGTKEHQAVYTKFRSILTIYQFLESKNFGPSESMIFF